MWTITGWYSGARYVAYGDAAKAVLPDWLVTALPLAVDGGILRLAEPGGALDIADPGAMEPADVVTMLEAMTAVEEITGDLPPVVVRPIFDDTGTVN